MVKEDFKKFSDLLDCISLEIDITLSDKQKVFKFKLLKEFDIRDIERAFIEFLTTKNTYGRFPETSEIVSILKSYQHKPKPREYFNSDKEYFDHLDNFDRG